MADNVAITEGVGTPIASDDVGGVQYQRVKLVDGTADSSALIAGDATNGLDVDVTRVKPDGSNTMPSLDVAARRGYVQLTDGALSIGAFDETGTNAIDALAVGGGTPHDSVDSGCPVKMGGKAIADLAGATMVAAADRANFVSDLDGAQIVRPLTTISNSLKERGSTTANTEVTSTVFGATASAKNCITTIAVFNMSATVSTYVDIKDGASGTIMFSLPLPAGGGAVVNFPVPLVQTTANTALVWQVAVAATTVYMSLIGFKSKA